MQRRALHLSLLAGLLAVSGFVSAQTKWDLPAAYPATNFHTVNMTQFAADVDKASGGKLKITVHANASLFKAPEIKRVVQGGQAQLGEILLVNFQNEWQPFGADGLPFLADSYDESMKLYKAQKPLLEKKLADQGMMLLYSVAWPPQGIYSKKPINSAADLKGIKWRSYSPSTARIAELAAIVAQLSEAGVMRTVACRFTNVYGLADGRMGRKGLVPALELHPAHAGPAQRQRDQRSLCADGLFEQGHALGRESLEDGPAHDLGCRIPARTLVGRADVGHGHVGVDAPDHFLRVFSQQREHLLDVDQPLLDLAVGRADEVERHVKLDHQGVDHHEIAHRAGARPHR